MANPRQRRKTRSSSYKPVRTSSHTNKLLRKQPPISAPKVIRDAWDSHKTVRQNYAALGLVHTLNPCDSGGSEPRMQKGSSAGEAPESNVGDTKSGKPVDFGKIIRDDEGNVIRIEMGNNNIVEIDKNAVLKEKYATEEMHDENTDSSKYAQTSKWVPLKNPDSGVIAEGGNQAKQNDVSRALDELAAQSIISVERKTSTGEERYLRTLVKIHGRDLEGMARDVKRNVNQYTVGQLRRAIEKAGGLESLGN